MSMPKISGSHMISAIKKAASKIPSSSDAAKRLGDVSPSALILTALLIIAAIISACVFLSKLLKVIKTVKSVFEKF